LYTKHFKKIGITVEYQGKVVRYRLSQIIKWIFCKSIPFLRPQLCQARRISLRNDISNYLIIKLKNEKHARKNYSLF